jgi:hypothetical protein
LTSVIVSPSSLYKIVINWYEEVSNDYIYLLHVFNNGLIRPLALMILILSNVQHDCINLNAQLFLTDGKAITFVRGNKPIL